MNINIIKGATSIFNRDIAVGGNQYTDAIQKDLNLSFDQAEALEAGSARRGRGAENLAADPPGGIREHRPRDPEDLRLLQGDEPRRTVSTASSSPAARRKVHGLAGAAGGPVRGRGRDHEPLQQRHLQPEGFRSRLHQPRSALAPPSRWVWLPERWATDDPRSTSMAADRPTKKKKVRRRSTSTLAPCRHTSCSPCSRGGAVLVCLALYLYDVGPDPRAGQPRSPCRRAAPARAAGHQGPGGRARGRSARPSSGRWTSSSGCRPSSRGPVHLLDELSKALPDFVWLASLDQTGNQIRLGGQSNSLTSVADFITALQAAGADQYGCGKVNPLDRSLCWFPEVNLVVEHRDQQPRDASRCRPRSATRRCQHQAGSRTPRRPIPARVRRREHRPRAER